MFSFLTSAEQSAAVTFTHGAQSADRASQPAPQNTLGKPRRHFHMLCDSVLSFFPDARCKAHFTTTTAAFTRRAVRSIAFSGLRREAQPFPHSRIRTGQKRNQARKPDSPRRIKAPFYPLITVNGSTTRSFSTVAPLTTHFSRRTPLSTADSPRQSRSRGRFRSRDE